MRRHLLRSPAFWPDCAASDEVAMRELAFGACILATAVVTAQQPLSEFSAADRSTKLEMLVQIIRHVGPTSGDVIAATIGAGLVDADAGVRQTALAAVTSRAAAPVFAASAAADWDRDRVYIQALRGQVAQALRDDASERVRS